MSRRAIRTDPQRCIRITLAGNIRLVRRRRLSIPSRRVLTLTFCVFRLRTRRYTTVSRTCRHAAMYETKHTRTPHERARTGCISDGSRTREEAEPKKLCKRDRVRSRAVDVLRFQAVHVQNLYFQVMFVRSSRERAQTVWRIIVLKRTKTNTELPFSQIAIATGSKFI